MQALQASLHCYRAGMHKNLMYLSIMIRIYISVSAIVGSSCPYHFVVKFWLSGSFRVRSWGYNQSSYVAGIVGRLGSGLGLKPV